MALKRINRELGRPRAEAVLLLVLGLWCLGPLVGLFHTHADGHAEGTPTEVEAHRIGEASGPAPACHHHPEGCPSDCHCPKIVPETTAPGKSYPFSGNLAEPSLVQCTEGKAKIHPHPCLVVSWLPVNLLPPAALPSAPAWPAGSGSPLDPPRDPPRHVPRASTAPA